ncbi:MAG TPA: DMT family transporter [Anaerolineales bacterium]
MTGAVEPGPSRGRAIAIGLFVTFLWSTSWVLIKFGLRDIPPTSFAGIRYALAAAVVIPWALRRPHRRAIRQLTGSNWRELITLGVLLYAVTQGAVFVGLAHLPAVTVNLILSFTTSAVALIAIPLLGETPGLRQWAGIGLALVGALVYFHPLTIPAGQTIGYLAVAIALVANAVAVILGRRINRRRDLSPAVITAVSMAVGGGLLLAGGWLVEGIPPLPGYLWLIIGWLALVNTALAFSLWNEILQVLSAAESSVINGTTLIMIPILAVVFLGETINLQQGAGLLLAIVGTLLVQLRPRPAPVPL